MYAATMATMTSEISVRTSRRVGKGWRAGGRGGGVGGSVLRAARTLLLYSCSCCGAPFSAKGRGAISGIHADSA